MRFLAFHQRFMLVCLWAGGTLITPRAILAAPSRGQDPYFEITAGIDVTYSCPDRTNANRILENRYHYTAVCTVCGEQWRIDHDYMANGEASLMCDNTNVYQLRRITKPRPSSPPPGALSRKLGLDRDLSPEAYSNRFIEISPGDLPLADVGANLPWLAFCSGHYLRQKDCMLPLLFDSIRITADAFAYQVKTSRFDDALGLPKNIVWEFSAATFRKGLDNSMLSRGDYMMKMRSIMGIGITNAALRSCYTVQAWTNYCGVHIPVKFELLEYGNSVEWKPEPWYKAVGQVTCIRPYPKLEPTGVLLADSLQFVNDYRFRSPGKLVDFIHYEWASNTIPATSDPRLLALFKRWEDRAPLDPARVVHTWRLILAVAVLTGPAFFAFNWYWRRRCGNNTVPKM